MICASKLVEELRVPPSAEPRLRLRTILVPMDQSPGSIRALRYALTLAHESRASVVVVHTVQLNIGGEELGVPRTRLLNELAERARSQFQRLITSLPNGAAPTRVVILEGRPGKEILDHAGKCHADLIVMAAHKHAGPWRFLHPNTVQHVFEHAPCPVVVVGPEERESA